MSLYIYIYTIDWYSIIQLSIPSQMSVLLRLQLEVKLTKKINYMSNKEKKKEEFFTWFINSDAGLCGIIGNWFAVYDSSIKKR